MLSDNQAAKYAAVWARLQGGAGELPTYIASVYLPCHRGGTAAQQLYQRALDSLASDVAHYSKRRGHIILAGDFNARVGHRTADRIPHALMAPDADSAGCALVDGDCVCDLSAPRGAEADAHGGMA